MRCPLRHPLNRRDSGQARLKSCFERPQPKVKGVRADENALWEGWSTVAARVVYLQAVTDTPYNLTATSCSCFEKSGMELT
jgi:hypothetical protein